MVVRTPVIDGPLDQVKLENIVRECTAPLRVAKKHEARGSHCADKWKLYMKELRAYRKHERDQKLQDASTDWQAYRQVLREGRGTWQHDFADSLPLIKQRFEERFGKTRNT